MADTVKSRRIIDVSNPGETAPHPSARPILVSHKPAVQDPMVSTTLPDDQSGEQIAVTQKVAQADIPKPEVGENFPAQSPEPAVPETTELHPSTIKQLVHDRTYFSPVSQPPHRHGVSWLLVLTLLALVGGVGYALLIL